MIDGDGGCAAAVSPIDEGTQQAGLDRRSRPLLGLVVAPRGAARPAPAVAIQVDCHLCRQIRPSGVARDVDRHLLPFDRAPKLTQLRQGHRHGLGHARGLVVGDHLPDQGERLPAVPHAGIRRCGKEASQCRRERGVAGVQPESLLQAGSRLAVACEAYQRHRLAEPRFQCRSGSFDDQAVGFQRRLEVAGAPQGVGQAQLHLRRPGIACCRGREPLDRLGVAPGPFQQRAQYVVRLRETRIEP